MNSRHEHKKVMTNTQKRGWLATRENYKSELMSRFGFSAEFADSLIDTEGVPVEPAYAKSVRPVIVVSQTRKEMQAEAAELLNEGYMSYEDYDLINAAPTAHERLLARMGRVVKKYKLENVTATTTAAEIKAALKKYNHLIAAHNSVLLGMSTRQIGIAVCNTESKNRNGASAHAENFIKESQIPPAPPTKGSLVQICLTPRVTPIPVFCHSRTT